MKLLKIALFATLSLVNAAEEEHDHFCACEAEEFGFDIDCSNTEAMTTAMDNLATLNCGNDCTSEECEKNWLTVQTHHDYCYNNEIPQAVEDGFHDYDEVCASCDIVRKPVEGAENCPVANCEDGSGNDAYQELTELGCLDDCSIDGCEAAFLTLLTVHDQCEHDALQQAAEEGFHDAEEACYDLYQCNAVNVPDQLTCTESAGFEFAAKSKVVSMGLAFGAAMLL